MGIIQDKLFSYGNHSLTDIESISLLTGISIQTVTDILHDCDNSLNNLRRLSALELIYKYNITKVQSSRVATIFDMINRFNYENGAERKSINSASMAFGYVRDLCHLNTEEFHVVVLNRANHFKGKFLVSKGSAIGTVVEPKELFRELILRKAEAFILVHNHPSGNLIPSEADKLLTSKVKSISKLMNIDCVDHLIVGFNGTEGYYSFSEEGMLIN